MANREDSEFEGDQPSANLEEGTYYERVFSPEKIRVVVNDDKSLSLILTDGLGKELTVTGSRLVSRVMRYIVGKDAKVSELREMEQGQLEKVLMTRVKAKPRTLKAMFDENGNLQGIASELHRQINWAEIRNIVERAIKNVCGFVELPEGSAFHPNRWTYKLPLENENVSAWVGVYTGNNIIKGRSGVRLFSRWRTEREGESGGVKRPACLNWCGMWEVPLQWFDIDVERLDNIVKAIGSENVQNLNMLQLHFKTDMAEFERKVSDQVANLAKSVEAIKTVIDESIHSALSIGEMASILEAYRVKAKLPKYIIEQILAHVEEETVWGFSQAVSWVRTHGDFKDFKICKPVEERPLTQKLENIAGEVLSLTPTINDFHKKVGEITLERLLPKEAVKAS